MNHEEGKEKEAVSLEKLIRLFRLRGKIFRA
jgi:hypothetical protein